METVGLVTPGTAFNVGSWFQEEVRIINKTDWVQRLKMGGGGGAATGLEKGLWMVLEKGLCMVFEKGLWMGLEKVHRWCCKRFLGGVGTGLWVMLEQVYGWCWKGRSAFTP